MSPEQVAPGDDPVVSVVVSTYNRAQTIPRLVRCLEAQQDIGPFEAVIVDDCSTDDTWEVLRKVSREARIPVVPLRAPTNRGPAAGRNLGWRLARAPLIAFTDDDCRPEPRWLARLTTALEHSDIVQGKTRFERDEYWGRGPFVRKHEITTWNDRFDCCNVGYRRSVLERNGGFDESFRRLGEDVDLGWRAVETGASTAWVDDAEVVHDVETTGSRLRDWVAWMKFNLRGVDAPLLVKQHPRYRDNLHRRWFFREHHPKTLMALAGLVVLCCRPGRPIRWLMAGASAAPWLRYRAVTNPFPARRRNYPLVLPLVFCADVVDVAAVALGSVRSRTVLL